MRTADFTYLLPDEAIAQRPVEPRHAARLLDSRDMTDHTFRDLPDLLAAGDVVVVNKTRVRAARLRGTKRPGGGAVEVLLLRNPAGAVWEALIKPARRVRPGTVIELPSMKGEVRDKLTGGVFRMELTAEDGGEVEESISRHGESPLPPYIRRPLADPERYQTMFADRVGSAAAPTAGLHFTEEVVRSCAGRGIHLAGLELDVGLDTFRPISSERIGDHVMHAERYRIPADTADLVNSVRSSGGRVIAIGTTVVRTLESAFDGVEVTAGEGSTDLFIMPGHGFRTVDLLVTNFHVPGSTLMVMIAAFMGPDWRSCYAHALARGYRFLSFGDAMLAERAS